MPVANAAIEALCARLLRSGTGEPFSTSDAHCPGDGQTILLRGNAGSGRDIFGLNAAEWATIAVALAAATLPAVLPLMVGVLARQFGIRTELAGYVISTNMGGILAGSLSCILLSQRYVWRRLIVCGLGIMILGNGLTMITTGLAALIVTRLVSGWGEGIVGACCYAVMAQARLPARSIALYTGGQAIIGAAGLALLPSLMELYGWRVFYALVSVVAVPALMLTPIATRSRYIGDAPGGAVMPSRRPSRDSFASLVAIFLFFVGIAMIWAFTERLGVLQKLGLAQLSMALAASSIAGLAGSCAAGALADRMRPVVGLAFGIGLILASLALLLDGGFVYYTAAICGLSFAWAYQFPFLFARLANTARGRSIALLTPVATGGALTAGPAIGGFVLARGGLMALCAGCLALTVTGTLMAGFGHITRRRDARPGTVRYEQDEVQV